MNNAIDVMCSRRSIRKYKSEQIKDSELELILKAGVCAPTGMNYQTPIIIVVQNKEDIAFMSKMNAEFMGVKSDPFYGAPTVLVVLAKAGMKNAIKDGSLVLGNLMNAAEALNIGSCWINRAEEVFATDEGKALLKKWGVEGEYVGIGNCILGYKDENPAMKPRKENYVYYVK